MLPVKTTRFFTLAAMVAICAATSVFACPFCSENRGPTLVGDFNQASMVLVGRFANAIPMPGELGGGKTDFIIDKVLRSHKILDDKKIVKKVNGHKVISVPKHFDQTDIQFLVFCDVYKGLIDPVRGIALSDDSELIEYLVGAVKLQESPQPERLKYCFKYLESEDPDVSMDAYREFAKADYKHYKDIAKKFPADTIAKWLQDKDTATYRYGLYASLLSLCGGDEHAALLRKMIDDPEKRSGSGIDGMLAGYVILRPKEGYKYLEKTLGNEKEEFLMRYACLRTIRFFWSQRDDVIPKEQLVEGVELVLEHKDMADFAIEDLRKWEQWDKTKLVLSYFGKKSHDVPVIRRAILRFMLQCPRPEAQAFVRTQEKRDPGWVSDTREILKLEVDLPVSSSTSTK